MITEPGIEPSQVDTNTEFDGIVTSMFRNMNMGQFADRALRWNDPQRFTPRPSNRRYPPAHYAAARRRKTLEWAQSMRENSNYRGLKYSWNTFSGPRSGEVIRVFYVLGLEVGTLQIRRENYPLPAFSCLDWSSLKLPHEHEIDKRVTVSQFYNLTRYLWRMVTTDIKAVRYKDKTKVVISRQQEPLLIKPGEKIVCNYPNFSVMPLEPSRRQAQMWDSTITSDTPLSGW